VAGPKAVVQRPVAVALRFNVDGAVEWANITVRRAGWFPTFTWCGFFQITKTKIVIIHGALARRSTASAT
jgi:hypothetical protein